MGWRFRKSFSPLPGVRLNFSPRGISTSVGAGPFRFYVGSQGAAVTTRIPGTSISYRQPIHLPHPTTPQMPHATPHIPQPDVPQPTMMPPSTPAGAEIHSASTATLTTEGLEPVKELLTKAQEERGRLLPELRAAQEEAARLKSKYQRWSNGWLFGCMFKGRFVQLGESATEAAEKQAELEEQERLSRLATEFDLPGISKIVLAGCVMPLRRSPAHKASGTQYPPLRRIVIANEQQHLKAFSDNQWAYR